MNWIQTLQKSVGVVADGVAGRVTWAAVFAKMGAGPDRAAELGMAAAVRFAAYGLLDNPLRLIHFLAQLGHESGGLRYMAEIWGPTPAQLRYEGRADLGNTQPGDGRRFAGRGPIQITGRANYRATGQRLGIDLERHPYLAEVPSIGLWVALDYWQSRGLSAAADRDDLLAVTRSINGGTNGLEDRRAWLARVRGWCGV